MPLQKFIKSVIWRAILTWTNNCATVWKFIISSNRWARDRFTQNMNAKYCGISYVFEFSQHYPVSLRSVYRMLEKYDLSTLFLYIYSISTKSSLSISCDLKNWILQKYLLVDFAKNQFFHFCTQQYDISRQDFQFSSISHSSCVQLIGRRAYSPSCIFFNSHLVVFKNFKSWVEKCRQANWNLDCSDSNLSL